MKVISSNVNVKEVSFRNYINVKDNVRSNKKTVQQVTAIASKLIGIFNAPEDTAFFRKCAWHLPEDEIWTIVETATAPGINSPLRYFTKACKNQLKLRGV